MAEGALRSNGTARGNAIEPAWSDSSGSDRSAFSGSVN
jgi:hypothetical protein